MITAPLSRAMPSGMGRLSMIIPQYYGLTITYIARLIIEHPREWLPSLADYMKILT